MDLSCLSCISTTLLTTLTPIRLFGDDTSLYIIVDDPIQAADQRNSDLVKIHRCGDEWLVKSESIILSMKYNKHFYPPVLMNQIKFAEVNSNKHLSVIFSNHEYLELVKSKAWTRINIIRKLKF